MIQQKVDKKILCSVGGAAIVSWHEDLASLQNMSDAECALALNNLASDERRDLFRELEKLTTLSIPFVQVAGDMAAWEFDYLIARHQTEVFSFFSEPKFFTQAAVLQKYKDKIFFENPTNAAHADLFTDETLTRAGIAGICLNLGNLEHDRLRNQKKYKNSIGALDHHTLKTTRISPLASSWWRKLLTPRLRRLQSMAELDYLKQIPANYFAPLIVIDADNTLDEQREIKEYIRLLLG